METGHKIGVRWAIKRDLLPLAQLLREHPFLDRDDVAGQLAGLFKAKSCVTMSAVDEAGTPLGFMSYFSHKAHIAVPLLYGSQEAMDALCGKVREKAHTNDGSFRNKVIYVRVPFDLPTLQVLRGKCFDTVMDGDDVVLAKYPRTNMVVKHPFDAYDAWEQRWYAQKS